MDTNDAADWARASEPFDKLKAFVGARNLALANEAQTRFDVIDRFIREVLGWQHGQVTVEMPDEGDRRGFVDYLLKSGDYRVLIEAKRAGAAFPTPTSKTRLKLSGSVLSAGAIGEAISQVEGYAIAKQADVVVATNGLCWCFFSMRERTSSSYATMLFPFAQPTHAEQLYATLAQSSVEKGSLTLVTNELPRIENRLIALLPDPDARIDRNNIADHIIPALNNALYADALLSSPETLERCFVSTEGRTKFDGSLGMTLADAKPTLVVPARRIRRGKKRDQLEKLIDRAQPTHAPPVTLIIGPVGAGKSTYLKHFELIAGRAQLDRDKVHWIYIDFEQMGPAGAPRTYMYDQLRAYLQGEHPAAPTDYAHLVEPSYREEIAGLARGPLAPIFSDKPEFSRRVSAHIESDFNRVEPYVDKVLRQLAQDHTVVVVLDNIDLYEDEHLETAVFAEGLALSRRVHVYVIVTVRDTTFVRHRNDSAFDAYELRKLWLDPPPFREVLSKRLTYSRKILQGRHARIDTSGGMHLVVPDLGLFFEIVQSSVLSGHAGQFIDSMADGNIRRGLTLV